MQGRISAEEFLSPHLSEMVAADHAMMSRFDVL